MTMNTTTHTPTPWAAHYGLAGHRYTFMSPNFGGAHFFAKMNKEDAAFIIEAVNAHDANVARIAELEAALKDVTYMLRTVQLSRKERWPVDTVNMVSVSLRTADRVLGAK
jgi:hypothetical protein